MSETGCEEGAAKASASSLSEPSVPEPFLPEPCDAQLRVMAMNLLARREHSQHELRQKLLVRFRHEANCEATIGAVLDRLKEQDLQSDNRFAEAFFRSRCRKGQGAYRIRQELQQRGVAEPVIDNVFTEQKVDWFELARELAIRRFGVIPASDYKERSKRARFLQYRGFDNEQIRYALDSTDC